MADTLVTCVRAHSKNGFTPADFVRCLLREFGTHDSIKWNAVGVLVCPIFKNGGGCCTMIGPMNSQLKQRRVTAPRKRTKLTGSAARPEQLEHSGDDENIDTDKNMPTMFNILGKEKAVKLENLIPNRFLFAQPFENLFALSSLAKDGRVQITADEKGSHTLCPWRKKYLADFGIVMPYLSLGKRLLSTGRRFQSMGQYGQGVLGKCLTQLMNSQTLKQRPLRFLLWEVSQGLQNISKGSLQYANDNTLQLANSLRGVLLAVFYSSTLLCGFSAIGLLLLAQQHKSKDK